MDSKKDIYNLWVQYTTKKEKTYFRQFIAGFVNIWQNQLQLNLDEAQEWSTIKHDSGPHLGRLPDDLLSEIEKYLSQARENAEQNLLTTNESIKEIQLLIQCLTIICRHFDNIGEIIKSTYIWSCVTISNFIIKRILASDSDPETVNIYMEFLKHTSQFFEVIYDPYLTWRNFLKGTPIDYAKLHYKISNLHPEIVPFIYDCFQLPKIYSHPIVGVYLINILGAVISGAQVALVNVHRNNANNYYLNNPNVIVGGEGNNILQNGLRAISPATVTIIIDVISKWESNGNLRKSVLNCFTMMTIVLQKSSPEQRQIDLLTIFQLYIKAINDLLKTNHFTAKSHANVFELSEDDKDDNYIDVNSLNCTIASIEGFLPEDVNKFVMCNAIFEAKFLSQLVQIPEFVKKWDIDLQTLATILVKTLDHLCKNSEKINYNLMHSNNINILFTGLKHLGKPSYALINECLAFAFDSNDNKKVNGQIVIKLIEWIQTMGENEQNFLSDVLLRKCTSNLQCKRQISEHLAIKKIVNCCLLDHSRLSAKSLMNLLKLIEELARYSIHPIEIKCLIQLLRFDVNFEHKKQIIETINRVSQYRLSLGTNPLEFLDIHSNTNGITIPEIRKWDNSHGFVFHIWIRLDKFNDERECEDNSSQNYRRQIFSLTTSQGTGYEFFIQKNGNFIVSVITKKEFFTATTQSTHLLDGRWHSLTVSVVPPKRLFSYHQINVYVDSSQKLGSTMKFPAFAEPFQYCSIGAPYSNYRKHSHTSHMANTSRMNQKSEESPPSLHVEKDVKSRGLFPNLIEKTFLPGLVSQVPSYFTLPYKSSSNLDPSVKSYPIGMQDLVFGEAICLKGQMGGVILADTSISVKSLFEAGPNIANILASDLIESFDMSTKFIFCFSPSACYDGLCIDLAPGNMYNGHIVANHSRAISIQDSINGVGGIVALFPILENIIKMPASDIFASNELISLTPMASPIRDQNFDDWEVLQTNALTESKIVQNPIACFLFIIRNFVNGSDLNKECLLKNDGVAIISNLLQACNTNLFDVNVLMSVQLLVESIQNEMPSTNLDLLHTLYSDLVFDFRIWAKQQFQIIIGHIQYITSIIKDDRKYFRKNFGVQFHLDVIQEFFVNTTTWSGQDVRIIRESILRILKYYVQKEINIKEISTIITFLVTIKNEPVVIEVLDMMVHLIESKHCKDQIFLLMYEPHMADILYILFTDKLYGFEVHSKLLKLMGSLLNTKRISNKHKASLRLHEMSLECKTLYPGLFSFMIPFNLDQQVILGLLDQTLACDSEMGYNGALCLVYHANLVDLPLKLEIARRLMTTTFTKQKSPQMMARQVGWQESIARLLIKKQIENVSPSQKKEILTDIEEFVKRESESSGSGGQNDLIVFDDENMELKLVDIGRANSFMMGAANAIENEIKELAGTVQETVVDNISSVYSVIRQKTSDIHDTFESFTHSFDEHTRKKHTNSLSDSDENVSYDDSAVSTKDDDTSVTDSESSGLKYADETINDEENLVYLVSNILFTILWRGVENTNDSWKERGQVMACINLIALNNELYCSHLTLRLKILELGVQAALIDLAENVQQTTVHQQNAAQLLRLAYDLVVLDPNEDEEKKCSTKLLDGVLSLLDILMVFQSSSSDDWSEMSHLSLGLLLKCSRHPNSDIVAMATAKLHALLQSRTSQDPTEIGFLIYSLNQSLSDAISYGKPEQYSFIIPVMKAMLEKSRVSIGLTTNAPDLPATSSGPIFFNEFQMYSTSKQWTNFIEKKIKPLYSAYQKDLSNTLWEPLNTFWAECYELCKMSSQKRAKLQMESRRKYQERILIPYRIKQSEEIARLNVLQMNRKSKDSQMERRWLILKRYLYGAKGAWMKLTPEEEFWKLSHHENSTRMRLKLEPSYYHDPHTAASNMRDNTTLSSQVRHLSTDLGTVKVTAFVGDENLDEDVLVLEEEMRNSMEPQAPETSGREKIVISQECDLITLMTRVKGRLDVTTSQILFSEMSVSREDGKKHDFKFPLSQLRELHLRKYNLRRSALEMFLVDQTSYFLNFTTKTRNKIFTKILSLQPPNILYGSGRSPAELLRTSGLTQRWINHEISNFEYLMHLNTIAGRSYNDLSQYPVFPWILADYTSEILDLNDPKSFRDLSKPIGVVNSKNEAEVKNKYDGFEDPSGMIPKFHYGTHYSNSAGVLHYMIRVEPFTSLHIELQSGRFDVTDRQFHSIPQTWKLLMDNPNDVKELIPEFFYFPEFLKNMNKFDLGVLQVNRERVDDVVLPTWAKTPEDFISIHRRALESEYVSQNLHHWIDLIFGYRQRGPKAVESLNVFYYCSYEGAVDLDKITNPIEREAVEGMINNFGQTPSQLMREPHPRRLSKDELVTKLMKLELRRPDMTYVHLLDRVQNTSCEFSQDKDPVIYLSTPKSPPKSFLQTSPDLLISITKSGILGCHSWMSFDKEKGFLLEVDATTINLKNRKKLVGPFHPSVTLNSNLFAVSIDGKYLYAGGIWDNSIRVFNMARGKVVASAIRHFDIVTCLAVDNCGSYLVTGSKDCTCIIWSLANGNASHQNVPSNLQPNTMALTQNLAGNVVGSANVVHLNNNLTPKPLHTLYGHDDEVSCVAIMTELDLVVSGSMDGTVNVHTIEEGQFIRTLEPLGCTGLKIEISFITISYQGQIAFSAFDDSSHSVHVYSINGMHIGSKYVSGRVTGLTTASDFLVVSDDAGDLTMSRLYGLKPIYDIPLHIPTQTVVSTAGNTHFLVPLRDGNLAVVGVQQPIINKKHPVLNV